MLEGNEGIIKQNIAIYGSTKMQGKCSYPYRSCVACDLNCILHDKCTSLKEQWGTSKVRIPIHPGLEAVHKQNLISAHGYPLKSAKSSSF